MPCYPGAPVVRGEADVGAAVAGLGRDAPLMTVHLTGTVPDGRAAGTCPPSTPSGACAAWATSAVNDGSLLPSAPGVNPQGTIMAVAHRNVARMLGA